MENADKISGKLTILLWGLALFVPAMLGSIGYGVLELVDVNNKLGSITHVVTDHEQLEGRFYEHLKEDREIHEYGYFPGGLESNPVCDGRLLSTPIPYVGNEES